MKNIVNEIQKMISQGQTFALATVMNSKGSSPRSAGAKMLVKPDGSTVGTVGGGKLESRVEELALRMIAEKSATIQNFTFTGADAASMDSICGGQVDVLVEYIDQNDPCSQAVFNGLFQACETHQKAWLVTALDKNRGTTCHALVGMEGIVIGDCPAGLSVEKIIQFRVPGLLDLGEQQALVEPVNISGTVFIFGAGHVSRSLAQFTHAVGFWTVVLDDRAEYANQQRFPNADEIIVLENYDNALSKIKIEQDSFVVIVTRGHLDDQTVLKQVLDTDAGYIGMIGSRRKCALIFQDLRKQNVSEAQIQRIHAPIGLPIHAETPEEIGISIVAELIQVRAAIIQ